MKSFLAPVHGPGPSQRRAQHEQQAQSAEGGQAAQLHIEGSTPISNNHNPTYNLITQVFRRSWFFADAAVLD
jgi:hypothetical protein